MPSYKTQKAAKIFQIPIGTTMSQHLLVTDLFNRKGLGRAGFGRKVPGTQQLLEQKVYAQLPQILRPALPSYKLQIPSSQKVIQLRSVEGKQLLNQRPRVEPSPKLEVIS